MSYSKQTSHYPSSRPLWTVWDIFREVGIFSVVIMFIVLVLVCMPTQLKPSSFALPESAKPFSFPNLHGVNVVNIDEIGPWIVNGPQTSLLFKDPNARIEFAKQLTRQLQGGGLHLSHDSDAPKMKILLTCVEQEYAIRGPQLLRNIELDLTEDVTVNRATPCSDRLTTWRLDEAGQGDTTADAERRAAQLVARFIGQVQLANSERP